MQLSDSYLTAVAATATGFIGFASVIGVFRKRQNETLSPAETAGLHIIIEHSLTALLTSLLPLVLSQYPLVAGHAIRVSSGLAACFFARQLWMVAVRIHRGIKPRRGWQLYTQFVPATLIVFWLQSYNAIIADQPAHLYLGQLWLLVASGWQFLHFVFPPTA